jgi:hypothetical protein
VQIRFEEFFRGSEARCDRAQLQMVGTDPAASIRPRSESCMASSSSIIASPALATFDRNPPSARPESVTMPHAYRDAIDANAFSLSTVGKDCRVVSGLFPLGFAHLEELFSDGVLWHVAELIEGCQNGRTADVTLL